MAVVTGHTCNATEFRGSLPKEERQRDCPACQRQALAVKIVTPTVIIDNPELIPDELCTVTAKATLDETK